MATHTNGQVNSDGATAATAQSGSADAETGPQIYTATLAAANNSGVSGKAILILNDNSLTVAVDATGLVPAQVHPQHIHGLVDEQGNSVASVPATPAQDVDGDGFVEILEGQPVAGPPLLNLMTLDEQAEEADQAGTYPTAGADGTISFQETYDLSNSPAFAEGFTSQNLFPLTLRVVELHGLNVPAGAGEGTEGEVDGAGGYKPTLPVAAGKIEAFEGESIVLLGLDDNAAASDFIGS